MEYEVEPMEDMTRLVQIDGSEVRLNCEQSQTLGYTLEKVKCIETDPFYLFISGPAGTGKTMLLKILKNEISQLLGEDSCLITAPTEPTAEKVNARTIKSTFLLQNQDGFEKLSKEDKNRLFKNMKHKKLLMIDVINYVTSTTLPHIDYRLRDVLGKRKPFGGLSVIVFGDLMQMLPPDGPPVFRDIDKQYRKQQKSKTPNSPKILWSIMEMVTLRENERLTSDNRESDTQVLERIQSTDEVSFVHEKLLKMCKVENDSEFGVADAIEELQKLRSENPEKSFAILVPNEQMQVEVQENILNSLGVVKEYDPIGSPNADNFEEDEIDEEALKVAVGCQVMLTIELPDPKLPAGSLGMVKHFDEDTISVEFLSETVNLERHGQKWKQFPIRLADSFTISESQGMEFDGVILAAKESWDSCEFSVSDCGHIYTGLSRAKNISLCRISPLTSFGWKLSKNAMNELHRIENQDVISGEKSDVAHVYLSDMIE